MADDSSASRPRVSRLFKFLLLAQLVIITALSIWLYNEYLYNQYLESYLANVFQRQGSMVAMLGLGGILAVGFVGILLKAGSIIGEIEHLQSKSEAPVVTVSVENESPSMPLLEVVDPQSRDDVNTIHSSMRRWNERSKRRDRND